MSYLNSISLVQFKNYANKKFNFRSALVAITGANGSGKTNLLDAIYYLCFTKSYFNSREQYNIQRGEVGFRIEGVFAAKEQHCTISCIWRDGKKVMSANNVPYAKLSEHIGQYTAVMIAPDDIKIINETADHRRKYVDGILGQQHPEYLAALLQYQKTLAQKNAYLKTVFPSEELLDVYDVQLAKTAEVLVQYRTHFSSFLSKQAQHYYEKISGHTEKVGAAYNTELADRDFEILQRQIRAKELLAGRCLVGPHTDDWVLSIKGLPVRTHASQGQKKSLLIALKLTSLAYLIAHGAKPILLLDDIFEKLDHERLDKFFGLLGHFGLEQIFLTHTSQADSERILSPHFNNIDWQYTNI